MYALTLLTSLLGTSFLQKPGEPNPEPPPEAPLPPVVARLIPRKSSYLLDRRGMSAAKFAQAVKEGTVSVPEVDLVLEFKNTTKQDIQLRISGAAPRLILTLKGKGVLSRTGTRGKEPLRYVVLKPGGTYEMPIQKLAGYSKSSTIEEQWFWTEPGEYTLQAEYKAYLIGAPPVGKAPKVPAGAPPAIALKTTRIENIKTPEIKLTVKLK